MIGFIHFQIFISITVADRPSENPARSEGAAAAYARTGLPQEARLLRKLK
ncbi:hypothetical protein NEIELOOT_01903 [Neisseria elongata subsp. glycolytica ATCC 29315]|uniref:Uncharacterized protein n=1 Tax=Neisseria elongata subsp. glycolytica ATCC 29315 TaxID=546263 RepID=D4DS61_NEIEG|nr:hypothetical protein NEIELOOT_01903 [Neisseria elongata subsp. glycolytica ATCC 29315]